MSTSCITITELNQRIATLLGRQVPLLWVQGEISNLTRAASGHWYFSLKDANAQTRAVMFRHKNNLLAWQPREGDAVQAQVLASLYTARGEFQLIVEFMRPAGLGTLFEQFLKLKEELAAVGWFDAAHKKILPKFIKSIGVVTSPQAAALRDVVQTLVRRAPHINIVLYPSLVQGEQAALQIAQQIARANENTKLDVLLLVRGGGSLEDLWAFNEKIVAQAIHNSHLPIVSGVGHETDTTIADFVADIRAVTPTAAAELVSSPSAEDWLQRLNQQQMKIKRSMLTNLRTQEQWLDRLTLQLLTPSQRVTQQHQRLAQQWKYLEHSMQLIEQGYAHQLMQAKLRLNPPQIALLKQNLNHRIMQLRKSVCRLLDTKHFQQKQAEQSLAQLNPDKVLSRGYVYVRAQNGSIIYNAKKLQSGDGISVQFCDGRVIGTVDYIE